MVWTQRSRTSSITRPIRRTSTVLRNTWQGHLSTGRFITKFDAAEQLEYDEANNTYNEHGFLPSFTPPEFSGPANQSPADGGLGVRPGPGSSGNNNNELQYREGPSFQQWYNADFSYTWYSESNIEETLFYEDGELTRIVSRKFRYNSSHERYLLHHVKEISIGQLSTGDCYEKVEEKFYSNVEFNQDDIAPRLQVPVQSAMVIQPNPIQERLVVDLSGLNVKGQDLIYRVIDNSGLTIVEQKASNFSGNQISIGLQYIPAGSYHFILEYAGHFESQSFIKL